MTIVECCVLILHTGSVDITSLTRNKQKYKNVRPDAMLRAAWSINNCKVNIQIRTRKSDSLIPNVQVVLA